MNKTYKIISILTICLLWIIHPQNAFSLEYFTNVKSTNSWIDFAGTITIDQKNTMPGDEIAAFVMNEPNEEILVGAAKIGTTSQKYFLIHIFEDDTLTQQKDGAIRNDILHFKYWQKKTNTVFPVLEEYMTHESINGLSSHTIPPIFKPGAMGVIYGQLNINLPAPDIKCDFNKDGKQNLSDVIQLFQYLVK
jgi:hypothetical protein